MIAQEKSRKLMNDFWVCKEKKNHNTTQLSNCDQVK